MRGNYNNMEYNNNNNYDQGFNMNYNNNNFDQGYNMNYNNNNNYNYNMNQNNNNRANYSNNQNLNINMNNNNKANPKSNVNANINNKADYDVELNQAKESLKLLKLKMNNGGALAGNSNMNNLGGNIDMNLNNNNSKSGNNINGNYRKPFKPNLNGNIGNDDFMDDGNIIKNNGFGVNRNNLGSRSNNNNNNIINKKNNIGMNQNFQEQTPNQRPSTRSKTNSISTPNNMNNPKNRVATTNNTKNNSNLKTGKDTNIISKPNFQIEEFEDDRPAFNPKGPKFNKYEEEEYDDEEDDGTRIPCRQCGRKFNMDALEKHEKICKKIFCTERKKFDMKKKRVLDSEHAMILKRAEIQDKNPKQNAKANANAKKAKWKKQSEEFRAILRGEQTGGPGGVPSSITDDYVHCNMCNRKYNENAYSKHLPTCERRTKEAILKKGGNQNLPNNSQQTNNKNNIMNNYNNNIGMNRMGNQNNMNAHGMSKMGINMGNQNNMNAYGMTKMGNNMTNHNNMNSYGVNKMGNSNMNNVNSKYGRK